MIKNKTNKFTLLVGKSGSGKTTKSISLMGDRPYLVFQANNIMLDDVYSYPKHHGIIIEEVNYKPQKDKILKILYVLDNVILTSLNEKDVPKPIINLCTRKRLGKKDYRQEEIKKIAPNSNTIREYEMSIFDMTMDFLKNKNRKTVLKNINYNNPSDIQLLSWVQENVDINNIAFPDSVMRRWPKEYFFELLTYSHSGIHEGSLVFPKRHSYSPVPKICKKLGLKTKDAYLVKSLLCDDEYKDWAIKQLDSDECKILNLKKPRRKSIRVTTTKLGDY
tara:strand:+ start:2537 stop:3367 length:831 start_codon:yes stop_codon:yes gene_type:complete